MLILVPLGMHFDAVVVFVTSQTLLFRLALAILCTGIDLVYLDDAMNASISGTKETHLFSITK